MRKGISGDESNDCSVKCNKAKGDTVMKEKIIMLCGYIVAVAISATALIGVVELSSADALQYSDTEC